MSGQSHPDHIEPTSKLNRLECTVIQSRTLVDGDPLYLLVLRLPRGASTTVPSTRRRVKRVIMRSHRVTPRALKKKEKYWRKKRCRRRGCSSTEAYRIIDYGSILSTTESVNLDSDLDWRVETKNQESRECFYDFEEKLWYRTQEVVNAKFLLEQDKITTGTFSMYLRAYDSEYTAMFVCRLKRFVRPTTSTDQLFMGFRPFPDKRYGISFVIGLRSISLV